MTFKDSLHVVWGVLNQKQRSRVTWAMLAQIASGFVDMVGVVAVLPFLMLVSQPDLMLQAPWLAEIQRHYGWTDQKFLMILGSGTLLILVMNHLLRVGAAWLGARLSYLTWGEMASGLFDYYIRQPYPYYFKYNSSTLTDRLLVRLNAVVAGVITPGIELFARLMTFLFVTLLLLWHNPILTIVLLVLMGAFYLVIYRYVGAYSEKYGRDLAELGPRMLQMLTETFAGIKEIKARCLEPFFRKAYSPLLKRHVQANQRQHVLNSVPPALVEILAFGGIMLIALYLIATTPNYQALVPTLGLYVMATRRLLPSVQGIFQVLSQMRFFRPSLEIICPDIEKIKPIEHESPENIHSIDLREKVEFENLYYSYKEKGKEVVEDVTFEVKAGQCVGLAGESGAGKSTLMDLMAGLLEPSNGAVKVDGRDLDSSWVQHWQLGLGYVPQSVFMMDDTVSGNIAFGVPQKDVKMERVREVAQIAQVSRFIEEELSEGYDTVIGERGVRLSGGQRQRLGIARALYHRPRMLVLDEATSALDGVTEAALLKEIKTLAGEITIIMVAHRLTSLKDCDRVFLLDKGKLVAQGTHDELLRECPLYARMASQA